MSLNSHLQTGSRLAYLAEHYIRDDGPDLDLERIAGMLNRAPCRPIQYQSPDRLTPALFSRPD